MEEKTFEEVLTEFAERNTVGCIIWGMKLDAAHKCELAAKDAEIARLRAALKPVLECDCWISETTKSRAIDGAVDAIKAVKEAQRLAEGVLG